MSTKRSRWGKKKGGNASDEQTASKEPEEPPTLDAILHAPLVRNAALMRNQCGDYALPSYVKNTALTVSANAGEIEKDIRICLVGGSIYIPGFFDDERGVIMQQILTEVDESSRDAELEGAGAAVGSEEEGISSLSSAGDAVVDAAVDGVSAPTVVRRLEDRDQDPSFSFRNPATKESIGGSTSMTSASRKNDNEQQHQQVGSFRLLTKKWSQHLVVENCSDRSPTFSRIIRVLEQYFHLEILATRLNFYQNQDHWKPFHKDSHAYGTGTHSGKKEDFTVGVSFGAERALEFLHDDCAEIKFAFPQRNGDVFAFTDAVNARFRHGVPKVERGEKRGPRISIIGWGRRVKMTARNGGVVGAGG